MITAIIFLISVSFILFLSSAFCNFLDNSLENYEYAIRETKGVCTIKDYELIIRKDI